MSKIHELAFNAEEIDELLDSVDKKTIYQDVTQSEHGLMSTTDKTKLDALPTAQQIDGALNAKVDKVEGKGLSKNDYTDAEKESVASAYHKPQNGIPESDLDSSVQTSLDKADTALQSFTETDPTVPSWAKQSAKPSYDYSEIGNTPDLSGFITKSVNDLTNYYLKSETYTKEEVAALIGAIQQFHYEIYATLPQTGQGNVLYLIGPTGSGSDKYEEYVYANNAFTKIGDTSIDLSGYVNTSALNTALADYTTTANLTMLLSNKADKASNATNGNFAGLDANGNITDSGKKASDFATASQGAKADTAYQKPSNGIPESDLSSDVQSQLNKHFKGWFDDTTVLNAKYPSPVVGDYAYVKGAESTDPAAIYECTTNGSWSDSGRTADTSNVQRFASGEEVNEVHIVNDLKTGGVNDVLSAEQGKVIGEEIYGALGYVDMTLELTNGYHMTYPDGKVKIATNGLSGSKCTMINCTPGEKFKVFGKSLEGNDAIVDVLWAFSDNIEVNRYYTCISKASPSLNVRDEGVEIVAPEGSVYLFVNFNQYDSSLDKIQKLQIVEEGLVDKTKFSTGQEVKDTPIVDDLFSDNANGVLSAKQGGVVGEQIRYSNSVSGVNFGILPRDNDLKNIIKGVYIHYYDRSYVSEVPNNLLISTFRNDSTASMKVDIYIKDQNLQPLFRTDSTDPKTSIKNTSLQRYKLIGIGEFYKKAVMFIDIDCSNYSEDIFWSLSQSADKQISTYITKDKVNTYFCDTKSIKEETQNLDKYLSGKTIVCFGDSLTEFKDNDRLGYCDYINLISGANIINVGCGGAQIRQRTTPVLNPTSSNEGYAAMDLVNIVRAAANVPFDDTHTYRDVVYNAAQYIKTTLSDDNTLIIERLLAINWNKIDAVTFLCGTNDWANGGDTRGTEGSTDVNTTLGAINVIIQTILTTYPHLKIYWFTPTVRWASNIADRNDANWCDTIIYNGYSLKQLSAAIMQEVCSQHIPVCDLYNTLGWNKFNFSQYFTDTDGTHPANGYEYIATRFIGFIRSNNEVL